MENLIRGLKMGTKADLGNGWTVENNSTLGLKFYKEGVLIDTFTMKASAIEFAEANCIAGKSEAEELRELSSQFFAETKATRKDGSLVIIEIESLSGGDAIRDAGGTRIVTKSVTYDFIKSWAEKHGADFDKVCKAINF
jgi:hypothetical protein